MPAPFQKYHLKWPWTPRQVENLDEMLGQVYTGLTTVAATVAASSSSSITAPACTTLINLGAFEEESAFTSFPTAATPGGDPLLANHGGTGLSSFTIGDLLTAASSSTLARIADVATGQVLVSGGIGVIPAWSASPTLSQTSLALVSTDGLVLQNTTAATSGVPVQISPRLRLQGSAWNGSVSRTSDFLLDVLPQNTINAFAAFRLAYSINGGAPVETMTVDMDANVGLALYGGGSMRICAGFLGMPAASLWYWTGRTVMASPVDGQWNLTKNAQTIGVGLDVATDAVLKVRTRAQSAYATVDALSYSTGGVAGVTTFGPAAVTSITVKGGIITAIS